MFPNQNNQNQSSYVPNSADPMSYGAGDVLKQQEQMRKQRVEMVDNADKIIKLKMDADSNVNGNGDSTASYKRSRMSINDRPMDTSLFSDNYQKPIRTAQAGIERAFPDRGPIPAVDSNYQPQVLKQRQVEGTTPNYGESSAVRTANPNIGPEPYYRRKGNEPVRVSEPFFDSDGGKPVYGSDTSYGQEKLITQQGTPNPTGYFEPLNRAQPLPTVKIADPNIGPKPALLTEGEKQAQAKSKPMGALSNAIETDHVQQRMDEAKSVKPPPVEGEPTYRTILRDDEGFDNTVYLDTEGNPTVGFGHKLTEEQLKNHKVGDKIPATDLERMFEEDSSKARTAAEIQAKELGRENDEAFVDRLTSVNFQLGTNWNKEHTNTWDLMKQGKWKEAQEEVANSKWNQQTPNRVQSFQSVMVPKTPDAITSKPVAPAEQKAVQEGKGQPADAFTLQGLTQGLSKMGTAAGGFFSELMQDNQVKKALLMGGLLGGIGALGGLSGRESLAVGLTGAVSQYMNNPDKAATKKLAYEMSKYIKPQNQGEVAYLINKGDYAGAKAIISKDWQDFGLLEKGVVRNADGSISRKPSISEQIALRKEATGYTEKQKLKVDNARTLVSESFPVISEMSSLMQLNDTDLKQIFGDGKYASIAWDVLDKDHSQIALLIEQARNELEQKYIKQASGNRGPTDADLKYAQSKVDAHFSNPANTRRTLKKIIKDRETGLKNVLGPSSINSNVAVGMEGRYNFGKYQKELGTDPDLAYSFTRINTNKSK